MNNYAYPSGNRQRPKNCTGRETKARPTAQVYIRSIVPPSDQSRLPCPISSTRCRQFPHEFQSATSTPARFPNHLICRDIASFSFALTHLEFLGIWYLAFDHSCPVVQITVQLRAHNVRVKNTLKLFVCRDLRYFSFANLKNNCADNFRRSLGSLPRYSPWICSQLARILGRALSLPIQRFNIPTIQRYLPLPGHFAPG